MAVVYEEATCTLVTSRNLVIGHFADAPTIEQLRFFERTLRGVGRVHGALQSGAVTIFHGGTPDFSLDVREFVTRIFKDPTLPHGAVAHVVVADGMAGVAIRAFLSTIMLGAKSPGPTKLFGDRASAAVWLESRFIGTKESWTGEQLLPLFERPPLSSSARPRPRAEPISDPPISSSSGQSPREKFPSDAPVADLFGRRKSE